MLKATTLRMVINQFIITMCGWEFLSSFVWKIADNWGDILRSFFIFYFVQITRKKQTTFMNKPTINNNTLSCAAV